MCSASQAEVEGKELDDEVFFNFVSDRATPKRVPPPLPLKSKLRLSVPMVMPQIPEGKADEEAPLKEGRDEVEGPPAL